MKVVHYNVRDMALDVKVRIRNMIRLNTFHGNSHRITRGLCCFVCWKGVVLWNILFESLRHLPLQISNTCPTKFTTTTTTIIIAVVAVHILMSCLYATSNNILGKNCSVHC